jgi:hypothetical protein
LTDYSTKVCLFLWASAASHGCTAACWLIVPSALDVPTLATRCPAPTDAFRTLAAEVGTYGRRIRTGKFCLNADFHCTIRNLLHAANVRRGTHGFTSLPKEGMLRIFPPLKIRRLRPGLNPRTSVPEASTLTPRPPKPPTKVNFVCPHNQSNRNVGNENCVRSTEQSGR